MQVIHRLLLGMAALLVAGFTTVHAQEGPRVVLFEDPALSADRLHYPLLISAGRGYRMRCASQEDEEAVIRGLGFTTVPAQILTAVDADIIAADPTSNPLLCPSAADFQVRVFANDGPDGLVHYLQFPSAIGASSYTDRIYIPGCVGLVEALRLDLSQAQIADPTLFFQDKIHEISCLNGTPIEVAPEDFTAWCMKGDRTPAETATVMAILDVTPGGISALGNSTACAAAADYLGRVPTLDLNGKGVQSLAPVSVLGHLTGLSLADNAITDLSPLTKLSALIFLDLSGNKISNVAALAPLTTLTRLDLADNQIEDIRFLSALALLTSLSLDGDAVLDLSPLQFLQALTDLSLARNGLTGDMLEPLTALGALTHLDVSENNIENFTHLGEFPSTVEIDVSGNPVASSGGRSFLDLCILHQDAPTPFGQTIRAMVEHHGGGTCRNVNNALLANTTLDLSGKAISDVRPVAVLTHLAVLNLSDNAIGDVTALSGLVNLVDLNLSGNNITDIRPVGPLKKLTRFDASGNPVSLVDFLPACLMRNHEAALTESQTTEVNVLFDISRRSTCQEARDTLRGMQSANANGRRLSTLDFFRVMENLRTLTVSDNDLTDLSALSPIQGLTRLWAANNRITSMGAVTSLRRLERLYLDGNPLNSLHGIAHLNKLNKVSFSSTKVRSVQSLASLPLLEDASMRNLSLNFNSFSEYCLVQRFDSIALGGERAFMAAIESALDAAHVDKTDCDAVEQWARTRTSLNLNKKSITSVKPIVFFTALQELLLYDNLIRDAQPIGKLRQLQKLNLNSNRLTALPRFQSSRMKTLYLKDNNVSHLGNLSNLTQLKSLSLQDNDIADPATLRDFSSLTLLDLRDNRIGAISKASSVLARKPYLKGNPVCRLMIRHSTLNEACRREPPLMIHSVIIKQVTTNQAVKPMMSPTITNRNLNLMLSPGVGSTRPTP